MGSALAIERQELVKQKWLATQGLIKRKYIADLATFVEQL